ncbi:MAG: CCA tRNA nucleotidyltransferase [Sulfurospirillum sp.]|nr:MAG: CCA tRNA nucleotidyltransferase [Sulfurospirillum sp.]
MILPPVLKEISKEIERVGGRVVVVGGSVRDFFLGTKSKDFDIEVFGLNSLDDLQNILSNFGKVANVGKSFGVLKIKIQENEFDFSFPREETKVSKGHKGFRIKSDGFMDYKSAAKRRDFTINSMGYDLLEDKILDPYGGRDDLKAKLLRHIDDKTFIEDPLRVYRAVQFCARFELTMHPKTKKLCKEMVKSGVLQELPKERVYEEFKKLLLKSTKPSIGFELLKELGILKYFPQLNDLIGTKQDRVWHPEGDVWIHTMMVIDEMAKLKKGDEKEQLVLMFGALCHDFGKPGTTKYEDGRIRSKGHEQAGVKPTEEFLKLLTDDKQIVDEVVPLVANHLAPFQLYDAKSSNKAIRRLSLRVNIDKLLLVALADFLGRDCEEAKSGKSEAIEWIKEKAIDLKVQNNPPKPLVLGRDLIDLGLKPSPMFKKILDEMYSKQLDGEFGNKEEALKKLPDVLKTFDIRI